MMYVCTYMCIHTYTAENSFCVNQERKKIILKDAKKQLVLIFLANPVEKWGKRIKSYQTLVISCF